MFDADLDCEPLTGDTDSGPEPDRHVLPYGLEKIPPGPFLVGILSGIDRSKLNGHDAVRLMQSHARLEAHFAAEKLAVMTEVAYCPQGGPSADVVRDPEELEFASTEVAAALCLTRRAADTEMGLALQLRQRLPRVWEALDQGRIDVRRVRTIVHGTEHLTEEAARQVVDRIFDVVSDLTTGQLAARIRRLCIETSPDEAKTRYESAIQDRRVLIEPSTDGTAELHAYGLPADQATTIKHQLHNSALTLKTGGDPRTIDQLRSDIFLDLLTGNRVARDQNRAESKRRGVVDIVVDLQTLTRLDNHPGELSGYGPVIADVARQVVNDQPDAEHRYTITNNNGQVVSTGITKRRPDTATKRLVQARNRTCVFYGCRMPAINCDIDHTIAFKDGGPTTDCNLAPLCRHHHRAKHIAPWKPKRLPNGDFHWTSPLNHTYTTSGRSP